MARQDYGNDLTSDMLQAGWKLSDDGFGLHTISATFKRDGAQGFNFLRGDPFPVGDYSYCKLHKQTTSFDTLGISTTVCEYAGIDPEINGGAFTNAQITTAGGLTTEKIDTIPNFAYNFPVERYLIAGSAPYAQSPLGPLVSIKNRVDYVQVAIGSTNTALDNKQQSFIGANGACFENEDGGKFIGFVNPEYGYFYGKTSYLAPQQTFAGIVYVESDEMANKFLDCLSTSSGTGNWEGNLPYIIPAYLTGPFTQVVGDDAYNQLLLTQSNIESFGDLYKVSYEIKFSVPGWHPAVYNETAAP